VDQIFLSTNGGGIACKRAVAYNNPDMGVVTVATIQLEIGSMHVSVLFRSFDEIEQFCDEHNFPLEDQRVML